jgi:transcriptional regulator with XRE-family HTH domain
MSSVNVSAIGAYIREQREQAKISLRQLAQSAGISNPYLSQIERGLRRPSADILQQIAKGLRISAEALYVQAGFLEDRPAGSVVREAVLTDQELTERQKQMLIEIYESFRKETLLARAETDNIIDDQSGLDPDEAGLVWPDDRSPAAISGHLRLALMAPGDADDDDNPRDAWSWTADGSGPDESDPAGGAGLATAATASASLAEPWSVATDPVGAAGTSAAGEHGIGTGEPGTGTGEDDAEADDAGPEDTGRGATVHPFPPPSASR